MQSASAKGTGKDLKDANKALEWAKETAERGLTFKSDSIDWDNMILATITDASWATETDTSIVTEEQDPIAPVTEDSDGKSDNKHRSQGARLTVLATPGLETGNQGMFHVIGYSSTIIKRVCRSTMQAETYALQAGSEEGDRIRCAVADMLGKLDHKQWEASSAAAIKQIWFTDCNSLMTALMRPTQAKLTDKRIMLDVASMRQSLWRKPGERIGDPHYSDEMPKGATDSVRWIDTDVMIADPLTKAMEPDKLMAALDSNHWDIEQPIESVIKKRAKQLARRKTKADDQEAEAEAESDDE